MSDEEYLNKIADQIAMRLQKVFRDSVFKRADGLPLNDAIGFGLSIISRFVYRGINDLNKMADSTGHNLVLENAANVVLKCVTDIFKEQEKIKKH